MNQTYELASGDRAKIVFQYDENHQGYAYTFMQLIDDTWRPAFATAQPLVRGSKFDLYPARIAAVSAAKLTMSGTKFGADGAKLYDWTAAAEADAASGWVRFDVELSGEGTIPVGGSRLEPEITLGLGELPPYERGDHVWFKTNVDNPAKWNDDARGNGFPACYYYDSYKKFAIMMFMDMTEMSWIPEAGIQRFFHYRCGLRRDHTGPGRGELYIGLLGDVPYEANIPANARFSYAIRCYATETPPTNQSAVVDLVESCLHFVPALAELPQHADSWRGFAAKCAEELLIEESCWSDRRGFDMLIPYVDGKSLAWEESLIEKGITPDYYANPGLDAALMMVHPLAELSYAAPSQTYERLRNKVWQSVRDAGDEFVERKPRVWGTWQYVYLLEEWWRAAWLVEDRAECERIEREVHDIMIPLAQRCRYLFPLSFGYPELKKYGNGDGFPIAGTYAYFMLLLYQARHDQMYLAEAENALQTLLYLPVNELHQESHLLAMAVQAADLLEKETGNPLYGEAYRYLLAQNLRQLYWFDDPAFADRKMWGMIEACTPIIYPAFFENVEVIARIASTLKGREPHPGLINLMNQAYYNNFYFFPRCLPEKYRATALDYIPLENLGTLEDDKTGYAGQEIYGAGQTFRAALLWDQRVSCGDRNVYVMSLNGYELVRHSQQRANPTFIVANLTPDEQQAALTIHAPVSQVYVRRGESEAREQLPLATGTLNVTLRPYEKVNLELVLTQVAHAV